MPSWTNEQKEAIYQKGQNIIVSAGAGSGKTAVLSERVLEHVKSGIDICELLILTFTNAAAAEMKERIRTKLSKQDNLKEQAEKIDIAYITTFDAYALSLVKKYNHLLNISDKVTITDKTILDLKKKEILTEILDEYYEKRPPKFTKLINDFCLKDDKEIFKGILTISEKLENHYGKRKYLETYIEKHYNENTINNQIKEYEDYLKAKLKEIKNTLDNLSYHTDYSYIEKITELINPLLHANTYQEIKMRIIPKLPPIPRGSSEEAKAIKKHLSERIKGLKEYTKYQDEEEIKQTILKTKDYAEIITEIILELDKRINKYKKENNAYDFTDISLMAISILENNQDVRDELKYQYKEILIDEYQDTSDLQDIFISFIENNNVYMVGDIKQSIYRFRNANPLLFKTKYDNYTNNNGGMKIDLNRNFRSRKEVTQNINLIFNLVMDDAIGGADYVTSHQMIFGNTAYEQINNENYQMEILNYTEEDTPYTKEEIEIFTIAKDIKDKIENNYKIMDKETNQERNITYKDFVILMDRGSKFETYKKIFEYLNIPLTIYRDAKISDSADIMVIKNIYTLIIKIKEKTIDVQFKYSFVSILRSYLYNKSDKEILKILNQNNYKETELYQKCQNIAKDLDTLNNKEIYNKIIKDFNFYEKFITVGNVNNHIITLDSISKIVDNINAFGYSPKEFLNYLIDIEKEGLDIKLSLNKENNNSVKIMTIHASKGLEYHVCYFSGLAKQFNIGDLKEKFYFSNDYGIIIPYYQDGPKNTILKTLVKQKYIRDEVSEKLRLFYVALTRAREKMIMVTSLKPNILSFKDGSCINNETREKYLSFNDILSSVENVLIPYIKNIDLNTLNLTKNYNFTKQSNYKDEIKEGTKIKVEEYNPTIEYIEEDKFSKTTHKLYTKDEKNNIDMGLKMHYLFEITDLNNPDYTIMNKFEQEKISSFIKTGILKGSINQYKEYEFIYEENNKQLHGIIDLLIEFKDKYKIVDYKLKNTADVAYIKQLNGYKNYIEKITNKKTEIYLYSIMDSKLINLTKEKVTN